jgi:hypothetical protein
MHCFPALWRHQVLESAWGPWRAHHFLLVSWGITFPLPNSRDFVDQFRNLTRKHSFDTTKTLPQERPIGRTANAYCTIRRCHSSFCCLHHRHPWQIRIAWWCPLSLRVVTYFNSAVEGVPMICSVNTIIRCIR